MGQGVVRTSQALDTAERFDRIAHLYDETREPLTEEAMDKAGAILSSEGCRRILEVGIGTGRIARPLLQRGFQLVGVDLSRGMLAKAKQKGIESLVLGDADRLPFEDKGFDAAMMAHVLHLLENPDRTFAELERVARKEIIAFVRKRESDSPSALRAGMLGLRQAFQEAAKELGYSLPERAGDWRDRFKNETAFLSRFPPTELLVIQDIEVVTTLGERLAFFEKRAYGYPSDVPEEVFHQVMERAKSSADLSREVRYRRVEQMAIWRLAR